MLRFQTHKFLLGALVLSVTVGVFTTLPPHTGQADGCFELHPHSASMDDTIAPRRSADRANILVSDWSDPCSIVSPCFGQLHYPNILLRRCRLVKPSHVRSWAKMLTKCIGPDKVSDTAQEQVSFRGPTINLVISCLGCAARKAI